MGLLSTLDLPADSGDEGVGKTVIVHERFLDGLFGLFGLELVNAARHGVQPQSAC